jgi:hypothetical protein
MTQVNIFHPYKRRHFYTVGNNFTWHSSWICACKQTGLDRFMPWLGLPVKVAYPKRWSQEDKITQHSCFDSAWFELLRQIPGKRWEHCGCVWRGERRVSLAPWAPPGWSGRWSPAAARSPPVPGGEGTVDTLYTPIGFYRSVSASLMILYVVRPPQSP